MHCRAAAAAAPDCSRPSAYGMAGVIHSTWQRFDDVLVELQAAVTPDRLDSFFQGWDQVGGEPCRGMRQQVCGHLQADPVAWRDVHFAAEALQQLCWERLHTGHWMDVPVEWRDAYALYTLLSVVALLAQTHDSQVSSLGLSCHQPQPPSPQQQQQHDQQELQQQLPIQQQQPSLPQQQQQQVTEGLRRLDLATLMGGLRFRPLVDKLIDVLDSRLQQLQQEQAGDTGSSESQRVPVVQKRKDGAAAAEAGAAQAGAAAAAAGEASLPEAQPPLKQQKLAPSQQQHQSLPEGAASHSDQAPTAAAAVAEADRVTLPPGSLTSTSAVVPVEQSPSMEHFLVHHLLAEGGPRPVVLRGVMQEWPAMTRWQDLDYLRQVAGRRTVPVEVGSHYLAEGWGTQLMTLGDFIASMMAGGTAPGADPGGQQQQPAGTSQAAAQQQSQPQRPLLYLAQHQLFEQVPALAGDILTPDYCSLGEKGVSSVNAWFGPAGTVTPLHQDPEHNLLAQVVGRKYVRLYDPVHTPQLAPHEAGMHTNTSRVNLHAADIDTAFPGFRQVPYTDVVLGPGDMLYMPPKWWHFVQSLSVSFSVSFWWS